MSRPAFDGVPLGVPVVSDARVVLPCTCSTIPRDRLPPMKQGPGPTIFVHLEAEVVPCVDVALRLPREIVMRRKGHLRMKA